MLFCRYTTDESTVEVLAGAHDIAKDEDTQQRRRITEELSSVVGKAKNVIQFLDFIVLSSPCIIEQTGDERARSVTKKLCEEVKSRML